MRPHMHKYMFIYSTGVGFPSLVGFRLCVFGVYSLRLKYCAATGGGGGWHGGGRLVGPPRTMCGNTHGEAP